ncbi:MAG: hypothetical protein IJL17_06720 [Kiritimatiellae bacterium]|nr:hypothetical protein [Kiritimatiellia bacterium]
MATFSRKGWSSDGGGGNLSADEYTRYMDDIDDAQLLRHDRGSRPGKTIHPHPPFREKIEVDAKAKIDGLIEEAKKGNIQAQFLLGKEYAQRGELGRAEHRLKKVADLGAWPEAEAELSRVRQMKSSHVRSGDLAAGTTEFIENLFSTLPHVYGFHTCELQTKRDGKKYQVLVDLKKRGGQSRDVVSMVQILRKAGYKDIIDLFDTKADAEEAGLLALRCWGRRISQEREERYHLRDGIAKWLSLFASALHLETLPFRFDSLDCTTFHYDGAETRLARSADFWHN